MFGLILAGHREVCSVLLKLATKPAGATRTKGSSSRKSHLFAKVAKTSQRDAEQFGGLAGIEEDRRFGHGCGTDCDLALLVAKAVPTGAQSGVTGDYHATEYPVAPAHSNSHRQRSAIPVACSAKRGHATNRMKAGDFNLFTSGVESACAIVDIDRPHDGPNNIAGSRSSAVASTARLARDSRRSWHHEQDREQDRVGGGHRRCGHDHAGATGTPGRAPEEAAAAEKRRTAGSHAAARGGQRSALRRVPRAGARRGGGGQDQQEHRHAHVHGTLPVREALGETFEFSYQPSIDSKQVQQLASCHFIEHGDNVIVLGPPGFGKTHLAVSLGTKAIEAGYGAFYKTAMHRIFQHIDRALERWARRKSKALHRRRRGSAEWLQKVQRATPTAVSPLGGRARLCRGQAAMGLRQGALSRPAQERHARIHRAGAGQHLHVPEDLDGAGAPVRTETGQEMPRNARKRGTETFILRGEKF